MAISKKQHQALEMMTGSQNYSFVEIAKTVGISITQLWNWRTQPQFADFQNELKKLNELKWETTVNAAREAALELCKKQNQKMVEFVLKNEGYNPTQHIDADVNTEINIVIGDENNEDNQMPIHAERLL